jgi:hypothetical protein
MRRGAFLLGGAVLGLTAAARTRVRGRDPHVDLYLTSGELRRVAGRETAVRTLIAQAEAMLGTARIDRG